MHQTIQWKFRPQGNRILMTSRSGGYTMELQRTGPAKFYGSVVTPLDYQYADVVRASRIQDSGLAHKIDVVSHGTTVGGGYNDTLRCTALKT